MDVVQQRGELYQAGHRMKIVVRHGDICFVLILARFPEGVSAIGFLPAHLLVTLPVRLLAFPAAVRCDVATRAELLAGFDRNDRSTCHAEDASRRCRRR